MPTSELSIKIKDTFERMQKQHKAAFTSFFSEGEGVIVRSLLLKYSNVSYLFYGGYDGARRNMLGFFPTDRMPLCAFPISPLTIRFRKQDSVAHRDVLGSIMALQIKRDHVGDILLDEGKAIVFLKPPVDTFVARQLNQIGKIGVSVSKGADLSNLKKPVWIPLKGTVSSNRLDALVSFLCRASRSVAATLIQKGVVKVNDQEVNSVTLSLKEGDIVSIRGYGRYLFRGIEYQNKKGRLCILFDQYAS